MTDSDVLSLNLQIKKQEGMLSKPTTHQLSSIASHSQPHIATPRRPFPDIPSTSSRSLNTLLDRANRTTEQQTTNLSLEEKMDLLLLRQAQLEQTVTKAVAGIKVGIEQLLIKINTTNETSQVSAQEHFPVPIPLQSVHHFERLESWAAADSANYKLLISFCSSFGGKTGGKITRTILSQLFSARVARQINWTGKNQKTSFGSKKLKEVVIEATKSNGKLTEEEKKVAKIEENIKSWFRNARDLEGGKSSRKNDVQQKYKKKNSARSGSHDSVTSESAGIDIK